MNRHIVIDARMLSMSGVGTYLQNLLPAVSREYSVTCLCMESDLEKLPRGVNAIGFNAAIYSPIGQITIVRKVPRCDLYWTPHFNAPSLPIASRKQLVTIHDVFHLEHIRDYKWHKKLYIKYLYSKAVRKCSKIVTVSDFSAGEILRFFPGARDKLQVIANGVDRERFGSRVPDTLMRRLKSEYSIPPKYFVVLGNVKPHKNIITALKAFRLYVNSKNYRGEHLVIAGKKEGFLHGERHLLSLLEGELKEKIHVTGYLPDELIPALYSGAEALIFPSLYEGFGLPPLEAHLCGIPVICSDIPSVREVMGSCARYFDALDSDALLKEIFSLQSPKASSCAHTEISWQRSQSEHLHLLDQILTGK